MEHVVNQIPPFLELLALTPKVWPERRHAPSIQATLKALLESGDAFSNAQATVSIKRFFSTHTFSHYAGLTALSSSESSELLGRQS